MESAFYALVGAVIGYIFGLRTNYIIGRVFEYRAFLHQAMIEVRLMSERLCSSSYDLKKVPRVDSVVRLCADQLEYLGQKKVSGVLRDIEHKVAAKLDEASRSAVDVPLRAEKEAWIRQLENVRPSWLVFFRRQGGTKG